MERSPTDTRKTRRLSAALFGNEKVVEVALALDEVNAPCTAQELAVRTGIAHSMVRDVLVRLATAGLLLALPKTGGTRSAQYYEPEDRGAWTHLIALARWLRAGRATERRS